MASIGIGMKEAQERPPLPARGSHNHHGDTAAGRARQTEAGRLFLTQARRLDGVRAVTPKLTLDGVSTSLLTGVNNRFRPTGPPSAPTISHSWNPTLDRVLKFLWASISLYNFNGYASAGRLQLHWTATAARPDENGNYPQAPDPYFKPLSQNLTISAETDTESYPFSYKIVGVLKEDNSKGYGNIRRRDYEPVRPPGHHSQGEKGRRARKSRSTAPCW